MKKILLIRMDRIGDLVLSLPVDEFLSKEADVMWVINKGLGFLPSHSQPQRKFREFSKTFDSFFNFFSFLREFKPDVAIVFHAPWWVGLALALVGVPKRLGVLSQWHSFLFFNMGIRQKRSRGENHELNYNLQLVEHYLNVKLNSQNLYLKLASANKVDSLEGLGLESKKYYVVHPGMGGSALNWPVELYEDLIKQLTLKHKVVITGTKTDLDWIRPLKNKLGSMQNIVWLDEKLTVIELLDILNNAKAVVAPSTGVVHLAASLGVPTIGIYSPIPVESPVRWGPKGKHVRALVPNDSGQKNDADVMRSLSVKDVLQSISDLVGN